ncbi:MAG: hypothetical protein LBF83_01540 [Spirochaetaceae bacterium]|jgi:hypothetical protein|nr:hypothetical protein [Spirochaetaceae bacterium]
MIGGTLAGAAGATVVNNGTITVVGDNKFYPSNGTTAGVPATNTTYTWNADAGGDGKAGWKYQSGT